MHVGGLAQQGQRFQRPLSGLAVRVRRGRARPVGFGGGLVPGEVVDVAGLAPSSHGARVKLSPTSPPLVTDGPFAETKELLAGYWILDVKSKEEAIEWVKRIPNPDGETTEVEIRWMPSLEDFPQA